jgi:hypothetical protein
MSDTSSDLYAILGVRRGADAEDGESISCNTAYIADYLGG